MTNFIIHWNKAIKIINKLVKELDDQLDQEEIEFNGRWCDDGGRNVE